MSFVYKIDVIEALRNAGYTSYKIRKDGTINQAALQKLREGKMIAWEQLDKICTALHAQPGDLIRHIENPEGEGAAHNLPG